MIIKSVIEHIDYDNNKKYKFSYLILTNKETIFAEYIDMTKIISSNLYKLDKYLIPSRKLIYLISNQMNISVDSISMFNYLIKIRRFIFDRPLIIFEFLNQIIINNGNDFDYLLYHLFVKIFNVVRYNILVPIRIYNKNDNYKNFINIYEYAYDSSMNNDDNIIFLN